MRLLITRPRDDAEALAARLAGAGIEALIEPLLEIEYLEEDLGDADGVQALLATSANGARAAARGVHRGVDEAWFGLPVYAVGDATARAARAAGFTHVESAGGDVGALSQLVAGTLEPDGGRLVHVAGTRIAGDLQGDLAAKGFTLERRVLYTARLSQTLGAEAVSAFRRGSLDGALFFSPRTARTFVTLARDAGIVGDCAKTTAYCLSPAVELAFKEEGLAWSRVQVAAEPRQDSLLALLGL